MNPAPRDSPAGTPAGFRPWASLRAALAWIALITAARIAYLVWVCPYELAADEAQYWDWSRRLDLSYYSKGPGVAWIIAAATRIFGEAEWAVRLPAALSAAATMLALAALAGIATADGERNRAATVRERGGARGRRAACLTVAAFCLVPAYHLTSILMTIDAPFLACWALACLSAWLIHRGPSIGNWCALAAAMGVGFLFKYTILLLIPGLLLFAFLRRGGARARHSPLGPLLALALFALLVSPVLIWNQRHGWPTLAHLLGHVGAPGGDVRPRGWSYNPVWTLEFIGAQAGIIGPIVVLMAFAVLDALRARIATPEREIALFSLCAAAPVLVFYCAVSFVSRVEGNWPIAAWLTMIVPLAMSGAADARATGGLPARAGLWRASIVYGVVGALGAHTVNLLDRVPILTEAIPYHRISGFRDWADRIAAASAERADPTRTRYIADRYTRAALLAYYLPGRPAVASAESFFGGRRSSYDYFSDTALAGPGFLGRDAVLVGATGERWRRAFAFDMITPILPEEARRPPVYFGWNYRGPRRGEAAGEPP